MMGGWVLPLLVNDLDSQLLEIEQSAGTGDTLKGIPASNIGRMMLTKDAQNLD